jgi:hypothetical protein
MERRVFTEADLRAELAEFEERFGLGSETFYRLRCEDADPKDISPHERVVWSGTYYLLQKMITRGRAKAPTPVS